jgi:hypothetical protein
MRAHRVQAVGAGTDRRSRFRWGGFLFLGLNRQPITRKAGALSKREPRAAAGR